MTAEATPSRLTTIVAKGGGISLLGQIVQMGMNMAFQWYMARTLGAVGVGVYTLAAAVVMLTMVFATLGLERGIVKFVAHYNALGDLEAAKGVVVTAFWIYGTFSLLIGLALYFGAAAINERFFQEPSLTQALRWMTPLLIARGWLLLLVSVPVAHRRVGYEVTTQKMLLPVLSLALVVLLVLVTGPALSAFLGATVLATAISAAVALWRLMRFSPFRTLLSKRARFDVRGLLSFSLPLFLTQLLNRTEGQLSYLLLGALASTIEVGIYRVGSRLSAPMSMMLLALSPISSPVVASLYAKRDMSELGLLYRITTRWLLTAGLPVFLVMVLVPTEFLSLFGEEFTQAGAVLRLIAMAQLVIVATGQGGIMLQMTKYVALNLINAVVVMIVILSMQYWLIPRYGLLGAAVADMTGIGLLNVARLIQVLVLLRLHPLDSALLKPLVAALVSGLACWGLLRIMPTSPIPRIAAALATVLFVYGLVLWRLKFEPADRQLLAKGAQAIKRRMS